MPVYRGKLLFPLTCVLERLDTNATATASGYDPDFNTPLVSGATGVRVGAQRYLTAIELPAQVEDSSFERQRPTQAGDNPQSNYVLVYHFETLEGLGLVDAATGNALLRLNDRLVRVKDAAGAVVITPQPGYELYCTEVKPGGGWLGQRRNLLIASYAARPQGLTG